MAVVEHIRFYELGVLSPITVGPVGIPLDAPVSSLFRRQLSRLFSVSREKFTDVEEGVGESSHTCNFTILVIK